MSEGTEASSIQPGIGSVELAIQSIRTLHPVDYASGEIFDRAVERLTRNYESLQGAFPKLRPEVLGVLVYLRTAVPDCCIVRTAKGDIALKEVVDLWDELGKALDMDSDNNETPKA